jgi:hypothetical protein
MVLIVQRFSGASRVISRLFAGAWDAIYIEREPRESDVDKFRADILDEAVDFMEKFGMSDTKFGRLSPVNDSHLVERLRAGTCRRDTVNRIRQFIESYKLAVLSA